MFKSVETEDLIVRIQLIQSEDNFGEWIIHNPNYTYSYANN